MKALITVSLLTVLLASCATSRDPNADAQRIARMTTVAELAAYSATVIRLQTHPDDRPIFETALAALDVLVADQNYDPAALQSALQKLPIKELQGEQGVLIIGAALILYDAYARDMIAVDRRVYVLPVINAIRSGLSRGLFGNNGTIGSCHPCVPAA